MLPHRDRCQVAILSLHYPPDTTGIAPYAGGLATGLQTRGHQVEAYVAHPFYPEWRIRAGYGQWLSDEVVDGVAVRRLRHYVPRPPRGLRRLISELSFGCRLFLSPISSDSVVVAVSPALFSTALVAFRNRYSRRRLPLIVWVQDIYSLGMIETKEGGRLSAAITKVVEKFVLRAADHVIAIHPRFADYLAKNLGVDPEMISVIRNWTHLKSSPSMSRQDARAALGWPTEGLLAVHTGNMGAKQGLANLVAAARLADARRAPIKFILIGDGSERLALQELAQGIERIQFIDPLDSEEYRHALSAADCLVVNELPGVATMAVPSKLTSYFDAARPILAATDSEGITAGEIRMARAGVVVAAGDPEALLDTALQLCQDAQKAAEYGNAGRRFRMGNLESEAAITEFERVIRMVAESKR